uniref:Multiple PDZ domain protein n=1 Tax=Lygus hesperus TaxID=30085 RepID=A0A0A9YHT4_LYGHE
MVLNTEWAQVEVIDLINDGSGLGFGIIGGAALALSSRPYFLGGVADRDGRLQSGDHILQIGDVNLRGMGSEQVAAVLRQSGSHVRLVVARPVEPTSPDYQALGSHAPIVPTKILGDPEELDRHLIQNGYPQVTYNTTTPSLDYDSQYIFHQDSDLELLERDPRLVVDIVPVTPALPLPLLTMDMLPLDTELPEMERFTVELKKDIHGLGITIAGYVCEKEELSGIFVKSISTGSAADLCKKIQVNDRIVEVDGQSLQGYTNHDAVEVLRSTGGLVRLSLERYLRGPKFEQLQQAIANSERKPPTPSSPSAVSLPRFPISADGESTEIEVEGESVTTVDSAYLIEASNPDVELDDVELLIDTDYEGGLKPTVESAIVTKWSKIMGPDVEIVVGQLKKFGEGGGLGISLEGTVDVEDGQEVRPHHYIRSILNEGPVGQNGKLRSGDELLEVNGHRLLGMNHIEVVTILKELPLAVRMVCGRRTDGPKLIDTSQDRAAFAARSLLGGSLQNLLPAMERLVKAKSDGSLASTTTPATEPSLSKLRSRSLEPITGLAMWSSEPHIIELVKGERGLGFSILDYQDPMNPSETVIVIRSLVPGGVAQMDGRLIPGDRLLSVNSVALDNASLDQAVQALKGAPKGIVRIAVAKPLPIPDSVSNSQVSDPPPRASTTHHGEYYNDVAEGSAILVKSESF